MISFSQYFSDSYKTAEPEECFAVTLDQMRRSTVCIGLHCVLVYSDSKTWIIKVECHRLNVFYCIYCHTKLELFM